MNSLLRCIRELDQIAFQQLCFHVMSERFPLANVRYPVGAAGDEGVDLFHGDLTGGATVWQCKAFQVTILGKSQKDQIRKSLRDAVKNVKPKQWILCLNLSLDTNAIRWFKKLQNSYLRQGIAVADPCDAMNLAHELMYRRTLRNSYFPNLAMDVQALKALMKASAMGLDSVGDSALEQLATENSEEYLDRLRERDARFTYEVTFNGERGPGVFPPRAEANLVIAKTDGRKTIKAFARDHEALRQDPVSSLIQFSDVGKNKILNLIRTGKEQHWDPDEIRSFKSTVPLLSELKFFPGSMAMSVKSMPGDQVIPLKLVFSTRATEITLDYVEFRKNRGGVEEAEIATVGLSALRMAFVLPFDVCAAVTATFSTHIAGHKIRDVAKAVEVLRLLQGGCDLEVLSLKLGAPLFKLCVEPINLPFKEGFLRFVEDLAAIAAKFDVNFPVPSKLELDCDEEDTFKILRAFALQEPLELDALTINVVKSPENSALIPKQFRDPGVFRMEHESAVATLFGVPIPLGATAIQIGKAEVINLAETMKRFTKAKMGTAVEIQLRPTTPVEFKIIDRTSLLSPR